MENSTPLPEVWINGGKPFMDIVFSWKRRFSMQADIFALHLCDKCIDKLVNHIKLWWKE
jgi:hypothetical protein